MSNTDKLTLAVATLHHWRKSRVSQSQTRGKWDTLRYAIQVVDGGRLLYEPLAGIGRSYGGVQHPDWVADASEDGVLCSPSVCVGAVGLSAAMAAAAKKGGHADLMRVIDAEVDEFVTWLANCAVAGSRRGSAAGVAFAARVDYCAAAAQNAFFFKYGAPDGGWPASGIAEVETFEDVDPTANLNRWGLGRVGR